MTGEATRMFRDFSYRTVSRTWSRWRRVVAKAEYISGKENPRSIVTSLAPGAYKGRRLYERLYCARGEMENRIKDQMSLFADRSSTESFRWNQLGLYISTFIYVLLGGREQALVGTELAKAQPQTARHRRLKVAPPGPHTRARLRRLLRRRQRLLCRCSQSHLAQTAGPPHFLREQLIVHH